MTGIPKVKEPVLSRILSPFRRWVDTLIQGTHLHFLCFLPRRIGRIADAFLRAFFSGIRVNEEQARDVRRLAEEGVVIYTAKYKSYFEFLFYHTRYRQMALPVPEIGFDYRFVLLQPVSRIFRVILAHIDHLLGIFKLPDPYESGYIRDELAGGRSALVSLVGERGFYRRFVKAKADPLQYLIEIQNTMDRPLLLVPQLMFYSKQPHRATPNFIDILFGTKEHPKRLRRLVTLLRNPGNIFVEFADPVNLQHFLALPENRERSVEQQAVVLRDFLIDRTNRHRQSVTGPVLKRPDELKQGILTSDRLQEFMAEHASAENLSLYDVHRKANAYLDEIAANYSTGMISFLSMILRWITGNLFEGFTFNLELLNRIKAHSKNAPLVFVPCHKSHIDYLILSYVLFLNYMPPPHIAAGKNLSFWPLGPIFRGGGAFFLRRTFKGNALYARVFSEYVHKLVEEGFNIEFFVEGGRSRTGKLLQPKFGILAILLDAVKNGAAKDLYFVPVYIGYDRILEENSYINELEGAQKEPESLFQMLKARKILRKRYGKIYVNFNEPIRLNEVLAIMGQSLEQMTPEEKNVFCRNMGYRILNAIDRVSVVTPHALVSCTILNCPKKRLSYDYIVSNTEAYMHYLLSQKAKVADTLLLDSVYAIERVLENFLSRKFIERIPVGKDESTSLSEGVYTIHINKRPILEYYKNTCIALFVPAAFTALTILSKNAFQFSAVDLHNEYAFLQHFFKMEFAFDHDKSTELCVRKSLKAFIDDAILMPHPTLPDTYNLTSQGFKKLTLYAAFLRPFFESYQVVLNYFQQTPKESHDPKERLKKIQALGSRMFRKDEIELKEALSRVNYTNAVDFFTSQGIEGAEDTARIEFFATAIQTYLSHFAR